jgi:hypothetical protein
LWTNAHNGAVSPQSEAALAVAIALVVVAVAAYAFGRGSRGPRIGRRIGQFGEMVVRCRSGHLFTTVWVPGASFKAIRLGVVRFQHCPVGEHWTLVTPVNRDGLSDAERRIADANRDAPVP